MYANLTADIDRAFMKTGAGSILRYGSNLAVYVASKNSVKILAVEDALRQLDNVHPQLTVAGDL